MATSTTIMSAYLQFLCLVLLVKRTVNANHLSCVCSLAECENVSDVDCPNGAGTVWDSCRCCRICARVENEPCGGPYGFSGSCAEGLECVISDFFNKNGVGVCTRIFDKEVSCENPKLISGCNIVDSTCRCEHSESCSDESPFNFKTRQECVINLNAMLAQKDEDEQNDSVDDEDDGLENCNSQECNKCPPDSVADDDDECKCDDEKCPAMPVTCSPGLVRQLVQKGSGKPGYCCDIYDCVKESEKNCTGVKCPVIPNCPTDSYQLPSHKSPGDCCSIPQGCQCLPSCDMPNCGSQLVPVVIEEGTGKPGKCCPVYECAKPVLKSGDEWATSEPHGCRTESGKLVDNGHTWTSNDPCTTCTCQNGQAVCKSYLCQACLNPIFNPNECCPVCRDTHPQPVHCPPLPNCTEPCINGNSIDMNGCMTCNCQLKDCQLKCSNGYMEDSMGNKVCKCAPVNVVCAPLDCNKTCIHGLQKDENGCDVCKCAKCIPLDECSKECFYGFEKNERGCSICKCKPWKTRSGEVLKTDASESVCKTDGGVLRDDGENWFDGCRQCTCVAGREMCSLIHCPPLPCADPIVNLTVSCCPYCANEPFASDEMNHMVCSSPSGSLMTEGETWMLDDCIQCLCHDGRALCKSKGCPPTPCSHPRPPAKGECCGICSVSNEIETEPFGDDVKCASAGLNSTAWREGSCTSCKCVNGKVRCYTEVCDNNPKCKRSLTVKGKCCPICIDKVDKYKNDDICVFQNLTFKTNEEWNVDSCTRCKCISGHMKCAPLPSCQNGRKPGRCSSCPDANDSSNFNFMQEISYIALLLIMICISIILVVYITRQWRYKKQQIRLRDFGCPPPQYQYKYIPTCPYDTSNSPQITTSEKASLAPV